MLTLKSVKQELGYPNENATSDEELKRYIRQVTGRIRQRTGRLIAYACDDIQKGTTTADLRVIGHGLRTGDYIYVEGSDTTPSADGEYQVTVVDVDTLRITKTLTKAGRAATVHPKLTAEFRSVREDYCWIPQRWVPLLEITKLYFRSDQTTWTLQDSSYYRLVQDPVLPKAAKIEWIGSSGGFPVWTEFPRGQWGLRQKSSAVNVRMEFYAGTDRVPDEIQMAGESLVMDMWEMSGGPKDLQSVGEGGVSSTRMSAAERKDHLLSPDSIISSWRAMEV